MKTHSFHSPLKLTAALLLSASTLTFAEEGKPKRPPGGASPEAADRLRMMREKLNLTPNQEVKVKAILEKNAPAIRDIMSKGRENLSEDDKAKLKELMKSQREEIASVLTPEQMEKMKELGPRGEHGPDGKPPGERPPKK